MRQEACWRFRRSEPPALRKAITLRRSTLALLAALGVAAGALLLLATLRAANNLRPADPQRGGEVFATDFTPAQGLGPLFNNTSCLGCHNTPAPGGGGPDGLAIVLRVGQLTTSGFDPMLGRGGPFARAHSVSELGVPCALSAGVPSGANVTSVRNAPSLFGDGRLDAIPDAVILAGAVPRADGILGRPNLVDGRVSRFGWKTDTLSLRQFVGEAFRNELGITTPIAPTDFQPAGACGGLTGGPEVDGSIVADVVAYVASLPAPAPGRGDPTLFNQVGCGECHVPSLGVFRCTPTCCCTTWGAPWTTASCKPVPQATTGARLRCGDWVSAVDFCTTGARAVSKRLSWRTEGRGMLWCSGSARCRRGIGAPCSHS